MYMCICIGIILQGLPEIQISRQQLANRKMVLGRTMENLTFLSRVSYILYILRMYVSIEYEDISIDIRYSFLYYNNMYIYIHMNWFRISSINSMFSRLFGLK